MTSLFLKPRHRSSQDLSAHSAPVSNQSHSLRSSSPDLAHPMARPAPRPGVAVDDIYSQRMFVGSRSMDPANSSGASLSRPASRNSSSSALYTPQSMPSSPGTSPRGGSPRDHNGGVTNGSVSATLRRSRTSSVDHANGTNGHHGHDRHHHHHHKSPHHHALHMGELKVRLASSNSEGDLEKFLCEDASAVSKQLKDALNDVHREFRVPGVLLVGCTGAGKSSLVNSIFGSSMAETGTGRPITQHYTGYRLEGKPVNFFDSKGLEVGYDFENVLSDTRSFLAAHGPRSPEPVHVVWYVINSASARVQPFEERLWTELCQEVPMVVLLNKADLSTERERTAIRDRIEGLGLPNVVGVFDVIADAAHRPPSSPVCTNCGSDDVTCRKKSHTLRCAACGYVGPITDNAGGLEGVVRATVNSMSDQVAVTFIAAQRLSYELKDKQTRAILADHYRGCMHARRSGTFMRSMSTMLSRLSILWEFRQHSQVCASAVAKQLCSHVSLRDRLFMLMASNQTMLAETVALGVMWASCVRKLRTILVYDSLPHDNDAAEAQVEREVSAAFELFTQNTLEEVSEILEKETVTGFLSRPNIYV